MTLTDMAAEYRENAEKMKHYAGKLREKAKTEKSHGYAEKMRGTAAKYEAIASDNIRTARYLEEYYTGSGS